MRIGDDGRTSHLSYCSNIHPGEGWEEHFAELRRHVPAVRDSLAADAGRGTRTEPFGIGLRLAARALEALEDEATFSRFRAWLDEHDAYVFTINGFPYGAFHGAPVKERVYRPDWSEPARLDYTCRLATLLARLAPPDAFGSISTLPGTFKAWREPARERAIVEHLLAATAHCVRLERESGVRVAIALEPEPCCLLETAEETVAYFETRLLAMTSVARLASMLGTDAAEARRALYRHLGVCHDVCHSAVEFESPRETLDRYAAAGIDVVKLQLSSALAVAEVNEAALRRLERFDEPTYLHQVIERRDGALVRHADLGAAIDAARYRLERRSTLDARLRVPRPAAAARAADVARAVWEPVEEAPLEWRVHFHVPVFLAEAGPFSTTRDALAETLALQRERGVARHLEVETYTWDVLPEELRDVPPALAVARELDWVRRRL